MSLSDKSSKWSSIDNLYLVGLQKAAQRKRQWQQRQKFFISATFVLLVGFSVTSAWVNNSGFFHSNTAFTCADLQQNIKSYLDGKLDEPERLRFEEHLKTCERCQEVVSNLRVGTNPRLSTIASLPADSDESLFAVGY
jgi:hypothetical protein